MANDLVTKIILKGQTDPSLTKALNNAKSSAEKSLKSLEKYGDALKKAFTVATAAITACGTASVKAAIDFEDAFAGVKKTVDETETTTYEDLAQGIRDLAKEMPTAAAEIAEVAENAGQLGISADNIITFSKVMVQLGETTNLAADEAASSIAQLFNITGTSMDVVDRFGATIVALGNNAATTESDIVDMATRIASASTQIGLSETEMLALSTTMTSLGITAERGGTAISTVLSNIDKAVALNSDTLEKWADVAGMSAENFSKLWEEDAYAAIQSIVSGMSEATKQGENLNVILADLGINNATQLDVLKRLSSGQELMAEMTDLANTAWEENTALTNEANTRYETMASKIEILKNNFYDVGITIGEHLMPYIDIVIEKMSEIDFDRVAKKITDSIDWVIEHFKTLKTTLILLASAFAFVKITQFITDIYTAGKAAFELVTVFSKFIKLKERITALRISLSLYTGILKDIATNSIAFQKLKELISLARIQITKFGNSAAIAAAKQQLLNASMTVSSGVQTFITTLKSLNAATTLASVGQTIFNAALWACPITWIIAAIIGLVAVFVLLWTKCDGFREFWINLWNTVSSWVSGAVDAICKFFTEDIPNAIDNVIQWFKDLPQNIVNFFSNLPEMISNFISAVSEFMSELYYKIGYYLGYAIGTVLKWGIGLVKLAIEYGGKFLSSIINFFIQLPSNIWNYLVKAWNFIVTWGGWLLSKAIEIGTNFFNGIINFFIDLPINIWNLLVSAWNFIVEWGVWLWNKSIEIGTNFFNGVINFFANLPSNIWTFLTQVIPNIVQWGIDMVASGLQVAQDLVDTIVEKIGELPSAMLEIGKNIVEGIWNGISGMFSWIGEKISSFCSGLLTGFKDALGIHSPSRITAEYGEFLDMGLINGVLSYQDKVGKAVGKVSDTVIDGFTKTSPVIEPVLGSLSGKIESIKSKVPAYADGGTVTTPQLAVVGDAAETIVPHGNTSRNRELLSEAAAGVGASLGGTTQVNVTYAPVINGGNADEIKKILREEEEEFERKMDAYFAKKGRLSFS